MAMLAQLNELPDSWLMLGPVGLNILVLGSCTLFTFYNYLPQKRCDEQRQPRSLEILFGRLSKPR